MISVISSGSTKRTQNFLERMKNKDIFKAFDTYGRTGVAALASATPRDTGQTANAWGYEIEHRAGYHSITWYNTHVENGVHIAVIIQYGHGTGTGGYVEGRDYINPAIQPVFDKIVADVWRQVTSG